MAWLDSVLISWYPLVYIIVPLRHWARSSPDLSSGLLRATLWACLPHLCTFISRTFQYKSPGCLFFFFPLFSKYSVISYLVSLQDPRGVQVMMISYDNVMISGTYHVHGADAGWVNHPLCHLGNHSKLLNWIIKQWTKKWVIPISVRATKLRATGCCATESWLHIGLCLGNLIYMGLSEKASLGRQCWSDDWRMIRTSSLQSEGGGGGGGQHMQGSEARKSLVTQGT